MAIRKPSVSVAEVRDNAARRVTTSMVEGNAVGPTKPLARPRSPNQDEDVVALRQAAVTTDVLQNSPSSSPAFSSADVAVASPPSDPTRLGPLDEEPEPKVQVFVSAALPAEGVSGSFDLLCRQYRPKKALQMILRRALDDYEVMLGNGSYANGAVTYALLKTTEQDISVKTSRMIPVNLVEIARAHFDPLGLESTRAFGQKLANAALAAFFKAETKKMK